jgi:hypothetical protein
VTAFFLGPPFLPAAPFLALPPGAASISDLNSEEREGNLKIEKEWDVKCVFAIGILARRACVLLALYIKKRCQDGDPWVC